MLRNTGSIERFVTSRSTTGTRTYRRKCRAGRVAMAKRYSACARPWRPTRSIFQATRPSRGSCTEHCARTGEYAAAIGQLEPLLDPGTLLMPPNEFDPNLDGSHVMAWACLRTAATVNATALLSGDVDEALDLVEGALTAGWRDYYLRQGGPYWAVLEEDPRFRAQMRIARRDIDRQRAEVERIDAAEVFVAKVDAAMATRDSTTR